MGRKSVVLGLAVCLFLLSFHEVHEVSCQVEGGIYMSRINPSRDYREYDQANVQKKEEEEEEATNSERSWEKNTTVLTNKKKMSMSLYEENLEDSFDVDNSSIQSEAVSGHEELGNHRWSMMDEINREIEAHLGRRLNKQAGSDGAYKVGESEDAAGIIYWGVRVFDSDAERRKQLEEIERRQLKAAAATKIVVEEGTTKRDSKLETDEIKFEGDERTDDESGKYQVFYGKMGEEESDEKRQHISSKAQKIEREYEEGASSASAKSRHQSSSYNGLKKDNGGSGMLGSLGIALSDAERRKQLAEIERQLKAAAATKIVVEEGTTKRDSKLETHEIKFEGDERADDEISGKYQVFYGKMGEEESDEKRQHISSKAQKIEREYEEGASSASAESRHQSSFYNGLKKDNGGSGMLGSLGIAQSGAWRCFNQDKNGAKEEVASIVIPKSDIDAIIKAESTSQGSASKTSSLKASLTQILDEKHLWYVGIPSTEKSETVEKLKATLKKYRAISARELVARSDFEEIMATAARYEELSSASVSYISRLSMYRSVIKEGIKASQRVQLAHARAMLLKDMAVEKRKNVETEFALAKALAERGDLLHVKIFAIKNLVSKLEAENEEVDMNFQKAVGNLSRVLEEASQAYEEYHVVERKWKEDQAAEEFSREAIESAEVVWVKFLSTL